MRRPPCVAVGEKPSAIVRRRARLRPCGLKRAKALPERMEAPAGLACPSPFPLPGGAGLIQPAGLARPQPGLMAIEHSIRYAPLAVGLKPLAMEDEARLRGL
jgi:hypothetical protein